MIAKGANLFGEARKYCGLTKNTIVLVDTSFTNNFGRLAQLKGNMFYSDKSVVFILTAETAIKSITIDAKHDIQEMPLANVVGMIPGKTLPNEYVIFSGHYDHLGINSRNMVNNDSIYNGANDDAAGTTAMMLLAKYYAATKNNDRTLIFAAFTAEEVGGFGAQYFSKQFNPLDVKAMFNIEMIGSESKWGKNSAFITGYEKTDMGKLLQGNLLKGMGIGTSKTYLDAPNGGCPHAHSIYFSTLFDLGLIGTAIVSLAFFVFLRDFLKMVKFQQTNLQLMFLCCCGGLVATLTHGTIDFEYNTPEIWFFFGLTVATLNLAKQELGHFKLAGVS
ncbi:MAG: M28 family peptidase [Bacteroidota bacterium]